ncbi:MAG: hypothetical protein J0M19_11630 [Sphingomonadales bacterium]|nr:hypothetical protein [Sphingomonadales bacterium]
MTQISRVDQAILILKERLQRLGERGAGGVRSAQTPVRADAHGRLEPLRQLARRKDIAATDLRRAFVRTLLAESFGDEVTNTLQFQEIADRVTKALEENQTGLELIDRALAELG